ncbi:hypothetical protein [uncultured Oceanicoccus sp.]|uniref:hypothetical protein n=1 Tax=uncultured Oceanicoccus sp. TaxID=1706381 RepID=UPI0030D7E71E
MTLQDYTLASPGYYKHSNFPTEYGGIRRQKHAKSPGLNIQPGESLNVSSRKFSRDRWVVGTLDADDRVFVFGCSVPFQTDISIGWVEEIDPVTLETIKASPELSTGGHNWCGGAAILADGTIITGFGNRIHKLSFDLELIAEMELPVDRAHNGVSLLSDGLMITRNLEHDHSKKSVFTLFDPHTLEIVKKVEFVGASIGRFCVDQTGDGEYVYATTPSHIHRLIYKNRNLLLDKDWSASYDLPSEDQGFAWCNTVGGDSVWFMDMGDLPQLESIMRAHPVGTKPFALNKPNSAPVRVYRVSTTDSRSTDTLTPFGLPNGGHAASPLYVQDKRILLTFDTVNRKTGAWRFNGPGDFTHLWTHDIANSNQVLYYPDTGEVVLDDVLEDQNVDAVVVDLETGLEKGRVATGGRYAASMAFYPGLGRDVYTTSGAHGLLYRVYVL